MNYVDPLFTSTPKDKASEPAPLVDWAKMWGGLYAVPKPEPDKPVDPRSEVLGRALGADKPLDPYAR